MGYYVKGEAKTVVKYLPFINKFVILYFFILLLIARFNPFYLIVIMLGFIILDLLRNECVYIIVGLLFFILTFFPNIIVMGTLGLFAYGLFNGFLLRKKPITHLFIPSVIILVTANMFYILRMLLM